MRNKVIAVTGGIGSGKSVVIGYLQSLGYVTLDCDVLAKEISCRSQVVEQVAKLLGDEYVVNGRLNRKAIRDIVFANKELLQKYNNIFFPEVKKLLDERISKIGKELVFVEISVFDAFDYRWDEVWLVEADKETRLNRTAVRDGTSINTLENLFSCQNVCADFSRKIVNNGTIETLKKQVDENLTLIN